MKTLIDFGQQPVSNRFLSKDSCEEAPRFPMALAIDEAGLLQLREPFPVEALCPHYDWLTCFEPEAHLDDLVSRITKLPGVTKDSPIGAYSFKDDTTLDRLNRLGYNQTWRLQPRDDLGVENPLANVETWQAHFTPDQAKRIIEKRGKAKVFIVRHVLEHSYDLGAFLAACRAIVGDDGYIIFEVPDCERALVRNDYTTLWEEHLFYFTPATLRHTLERHGFGITHFESWEYPFENSLIAIAQPTKPKADLPKATQVATEQERAEAFAGEYPKVRSSIQESLARLQKEKGKIALFGAGHLSVAFISLMGIGDYVHCVIDDNEYKKGLRMPVHGLPILGSEALYSEGIAVCLLSLNPQNQPKVIARHERFVQEGGVFASIFPGSEGYLGDSLT